MVKVASPSVVAVVVSYNRLALLQRVVPAVLAQTLPPTTVLVIDNGSTDGSRDYLASLLPTIDVIEAGANLGGAGGFGTGLAWALEGGADYVWLLDDDAVPYPDALEHLVASLERAQDAPFAAPMVMDGEGNLGPRNRPRFTAPPAEHWRAAVDGEVAITTSSFVGPLIRARAARETHLPLTDFFIWHDDTEYTARLARTATGRAVAKAKIAHLVTNAGPDSYVPNRAFYNVRNLVWCTRESALSVMTRKEWRRITFATIIRQARIAGFRQWGSVAFTTGRAVVAGLRRRPTRQSSAELVLVSQARDAIRFASRD